MQGAQEVTALRDAEVPVRRRRLLRKLSGERLKRLLGRIQAALLPWSYELWLEAVLNLEDVVSLDAELRSADSRERAAVVAGFLSGEDRQAADRLLPYLAERLTNPLAVALPERSRTWVKGLALRAAAAIDARPNQGEALWRIRSGLERARRESRPVRQRETVTVRQTARGIGIDSASAIDAPSGLPPGSSLALLATRDGRLELRESSDDLPTQDDHAVLPDYPWASLRGIDSFGAWIEFEYRGVSQRLRWIPPGRFRMGSPEDEPGRYPYEGPRHEVLIEEGYWLFDTPVTQGLWEAVMGSNPSEFVSPERPVERVNWREAMEFIGKLNAAIPGLGLSLPSEAQWEYACRAGTETAVYSGELEILGERNAPALDAIAWYGGNSGEGYELSEGWNTSDWKEQQQYPNAKAGTREVKGKAASGWGLYDML
ncbi:MAG: formylglycine-generating enzyme family protein, partial [Gammaproteobacteria bacterium]|nr:formylglycine-generating enzyme family protein [Gammaproteobacteria bacterium]